MPLFRKNSSSSQSSEKKTSLLNRLGQWGTDSSEKDNDVVANEPPHHHHHHHHHHHTSGSTRNDEQSKITQDHEDRDPHYRVSASHTRESGDSQHEHSHRQQPRSREQSLSAEAQAQARQHNASSLIEPVQGALTREDMHQLFYGAPHFMLEQGRRGRYFPQSFFPWNSHPDVTDLRDRIILRHESFALSTLHAHLPIPDEVNWKPGTESPFKREGQETNKRPVVDLGIYERPNMLGLTGREPGTIGFRFFLERAVADGLKDEKYEDAGQEDVKAARSSASEAFRVLSYDEGHARVGKHAPRQNRIELVKGGYNAWKQIGVRDISMKMITERLERYSTLRDQVVDAGWKATVLDIYSETELGEHLFTDLLHVPSGIVEGHDKNGLKVQIEALVKVLTTPGVWLDLSLPAERLLFGQVIQTRQDEQLVDGSGLDQRPKRKWALIQLLLAVELFFRLDTALHLEVAQSTHKLDISSEEIHHFNSLRSLKVDWDLVVARRFLALCHVKDLQNIPGLAAAQHDTQQELHQEHRPSFLGRFKSSVKIEDHSSNDNDDIWDCAILPRQPKVMVEGLIRFAEHIDWPNLDHIKKILIEKLCRPETEKETILARGIEHIEHPHISQHLTDHAIVELRAASAGTVGGPMSHIWFSGLIVPGFNSCDLLISTLLENDPEALPKLGSMGHLRAGFVLNNRSWWSKVGIIHHILAPKANGHESMGWIGLPSDINPVDDNGQPYPDGWMIIGGQSPPILRNGHRIFDGDRLAKESSPLGIGKGKMTSSEFNMVTDAIINEMPEFYTKDVQLVLTKGAMENSYHTYRASMHFTIPFTSTNEDQYVTYQLTYDVRFVSGHPCRLPRGHIQQRNKPGNHQEQSITQAIDQSDNCNSTTSSSAPGGPPSSHLPAHPLHKSYHFVTHSITDVLDGDISLMNPTDHASPVWIIDATGSATQSNEVLVRAWCAKVGRDAIIARVGSTCLSCAVREAKALQIGVIVRVGERVGL